MNINDFSGAKLAVLAKGHVLTLLRDNIPEIPWPNMWDLPGGGREGVEKPLQCALRETFEESALRVQESDVRWARIFPNSKPGQLAHWFFVATPGWLTLPPVHLGNEGQSIRWTPIDEYLSLENAVPHLQTRLSHYLEELKTHA